MKRPSKHFCCDFETYFSSKDKYSLRTQKFSMTQYIRDDRFKTISMAYRTDRMKKAKVVFGDDEIRKVLSKVDWANTALVAHNTAFDGAILSYHYAVVPAYYICTMSMARPIVGHTISAGLDSVAKYFGLTGKTKADALKTLDGVLEPTPEQLKQLGEYNCDDVDDTWAIYKKLAADLPADEMDLIHHTVKAYTDPVLTVNKPMAQAEYEKEREERRYAVLAAAPIINNIYEVLQYEGSLDELPYMRNPPTKSNPLGTPKKGEVEQWEPSEDPEVQYNRLLKILASADKLAAVFGFLGYQAPTKFSAKQNKEIPAFSLGDLAFQQLANHEDEDIRLLHAARVAAKSDMAEQRAWRLLEHSKNGPLPIMLNYAKAHTLRWTGGDLMNPQNFPRGSNLRRAITAPKGYKINVVDSGQIEARTNALIAGQEDLLDNFREYDKLGDKQHDPYVIMASDIYDKATNEITKEERFIGKIAVLGLGYQMGIPKFINTCELGAMGPPVKVPYELGKRAVDTYRSTNHHIVEFWEFLQEDAIPVLAGLHPDHTEIGWDFNNNKGQLWFEKGLLHLPNNMHLHYEDVRRTKGTYGWEYRYQVTPREWSKLYGGLLCENIVQCLARIIVAEQVLEIAKRYRILTLTHDECVYLSKEEEADEAQDFGLNAFTLSKDWYDGMPLKGDGGYDDCYSK